MASIAASARNLAHGHLTSPEHAEQPGQPEQNQTITLRPGPLTPAEVVAVARHGVPVTIAKEALEAVAATRQRVEELAADPTPVYGISTGFGALARRHIPAESRAQLQRSLVRSHAAGSGPEVEREVIRALMLLRLSTLCTGRTGVRPVVVETYAALLNSGITPIVHEYGSLGCSGDLAPLAHCALVLMGEGRARNAQGEEVSVPEALAEAGIEPLELREKEGLALINGTDGMLGQLCLALADLETLATTSDIAVAMTLEGLLGTLGVFDADLQDLRPHPGQAASAANVRAVAADSPLLAAAAAEFSQNQVQDAYSVRCAPQVAGGFRDTLEHARAVAQRELAAAVDNPVVALDGRVTSNGNFHGAPVAYALDFLAIVAADLASISERRTDRFLDTARNRGLPAFLAGDPGVDSGHMIAQYTQAGIVSELKRLAAPASVDSIPSSAMQEDHVSMGWAAARKLRRVVDGLTRVLAVEVLTAARATQMREGEPARGTSAAIEALRAGVPGAGTDRFLAPEIEYAVDLVRSGALVAAVERVVGELN
ncbi:MULTISPECIES: histidine ammonia-lyase [unclassified Corynebacterium]|uniref:histidine ammonia-lyase n=1 Tax=unclassified Corynebacterium TaxID=2624378 RepID=UPI0029CA1520|nr:MULTISPECIES: histidine ammonia-lyase [unclassified Corynebacterium]WPF65643.1 histidine ammonia-lyase [Corynebacterium sp. 22KM0430]WPF68138.1 histidine ammonia-lyase [Corynebacterium sp. 21KM1197]